MMIHNLYMKKIFTPRIYNLNKNNGSLIVPRKKMKKKIRIYFYINNKNIIYTPKSLLFANIVNNLKNL